ncbi:DUF2975 domain-containing protein [Tenacibaculum geojense]|uniref:DUF2975 domain-containing protein n=1 Tax=Tenacibaculum geojense TaxID=915352 RepID=A0ABW3JR42_9FLAO
MKKAVLFKTLVDILYILHFIGLVGIIFIIPFGTININQVNMDVENWSLFYWSIFIVSLFAYIIFLRGLYFLRKMARFLLNNKYFSENTIENLKKSGNNFLCTGIISFVLIIVLWLIKLIGGKFELIYNNNLLIPLFLSIIGMFFIIQSNALNLAKVIKEENELTV